MKKENKGITLIALVITIIVLLILAGVTVVTLTGDNGLLQKAQNAGKQSKTAEAEEQIKLLYAEYQISKYAEGNISAGDYLKEQLEKTYGEGNVDIISSEESIVLKIIENGESKFYEYNPSTGISKKLQKGINYNGKTASEIQPGDDITIGSEKFKVFAVENNTIKAMPYYNITLTDTPVQSKDAGKISFADEVYWTANEDINMLKINDNNSGYKNNIQKYIDRYKTTIETFAEKDINVRAARRSELKGTGIRDNGYSYWLCTSSEENAIDIYMSLDYMFFARPYTWSNGVRPIIEIPMK